MRRVTVVLSLTLMLLGSLVVSAYSAAAAPAQPYNESFCVTDTFEGTVYAYCRQVRGVVQQNLSASGNAIFVMNEEACFQAFINGEVVSEGCTKTHFNTLDRDYEQQVYHANDQSQYTLEYDGTTYTCTIRTNVTYTNGEVRHEDVQMECTPQLQVSHS